MYPSNQAVCCSVLGVGGLLSLVVTPQIKKGSRTQGQIEGKKTLFLPRPAGDDQFLARLRAR